VTKTQRRNFSVNGPAGPSGIHGSVPGRLEQVGQMVAGACSEFRASMVGNKRLRVSI
jgi:hypothetical protein